MLGVVFIMVSFATAFGGCNATLEAGGWHLFWVLWAWQFATQVAGKLGLALWKAGRP